MDIKVKNNKMIEDIKKFDITQEVKKYDYEQEGILTKSLPKILFKGNSILVTFIQFIDLRLIMMFKYIDKLKKFKWITHYE